MQNPKKVQNAASVIVSALSDLSGQTGQAIRPRVGVVCGTGLGGLADALTDACPLPYAQVPGFPQSTVASHEGRFLFGRIGTVDVVLQQGRCHLYEGYAPEDVCMGVRTMAALGVSTIIVTNAAGCLNPQWDAGDLMDYLAAVGTRR